MKNLNQGGWYPDRDLNQTPPNTRLEYYLFTRMMDWEGCGRSQSDLRYYLSI
jgi:hypothetical protein